MRKAALFLLSLSTFLTSCTQEKGKPVQADTQYFDDGSKWSGVDLLDSLEGDRVHDYEKEYKIIIPAQFTNLPLAWGTVYFTGNKKAKTKDNIFFLVANYDTSGTQIVFDKNGNADFRDDSILQTEIDSSFIVTFQNRKDEKALFPLRFVLHNNVIDTTLVQFHKIMTYRNPCALPARFMLFEKRMNFRKIVLPDSNVITLQDFDCNGLYNDRGDKIIAGDIQKQRRLEHHSPMKNKNVKRGAELPFLNNTYRIIDVDKYGNSVNLTPLNKIIDTTEKLAEFRFRDETGDKKKFIIHSAKLYSVLYIWGAWCIGCRYQAPDFVKLMKENENRIDYYTFNTGDKEETMMKYITVKQMPFKPWRVTPAVVKSLGIESFPTYLVVDNHNRIILRTSSVGELSQFFADVNKRSVQ